MRVIVFGASGGTGKQIVLQLLDAGHLVTAFVRTSLKFNLQHFNLNVLQGDALDAEKVEQAISGQDAVISALGPNHPSVPTMMETAAKNIISAMQMHGVKRLISTTGAGVDDSQDQPKLFDKAMKNLLTLMAGDVLRDSDANVNLIRSSNLDWTIVRFPRLMNGAHTGQYRVGYIGKDSGVQLSRADAADFIVNALENGEYVHKAPVVSY